MDCYLINSSRFGWGSDHITVNLEKTSLLDQFAKGDVIDIGSGSGAYANHLTKMGHSVVAVDSEKKFIQKSSKKYPQIKFTHSSALKLPFEDNQFDTAILFDVLEHIDDVIALREASRIAKRIIISVPLTNNPQLQKWSLSHHHYMDKTHKREYTTKSLRTLLKISGLKALYIKESLPISIKGLTIDYLSNGSFMKTLFLKLMLKPFSPPQIYSAIFAVTERK